MNDLWGNLNLSDNKETTANIHSIMNEQCMALKERTHNSVLAVFDIKKIEVINPLNSMALSNITPLIEALEPYSTVKKESIGNIKFDSLENADSFYNVKEYGFAIYNNDYKFKVFDIKISPVYPVEMLIDEGILKNISDEICNYADYNEKNNCLKIQCESDFCSVLRMILQDKKLHFIIREMINRSHSKKEQKENEDKKRVIICEGKTDERIIRAISHRFECDNVDIVIAGGKKELPIALKKVLSKNYNCPILVLADSDGNTDETQMLFNNIENQNKYKLVIIENCIEDWFSIDKNNFDRLKLVQEIDKVDFEEIKRKHDSFAKVLDFIK